MNVRKILTLVLTVLMTANFFAACGKQSSDTQGSNVTNATPEVKQNTASPEAKKDPVTVTIFVPPSLDKNENYNALLDEFMKNEPNIKIEKNVVPGEGGDMFQKIDVSVMSGDTTDLIPFPNHIFENRYASSGLLTPLNDLANQANYDLDKVYGKYLVKYDNGTIYTMPNSTNIWAVYYNKKIFDEANVPYPSGAWTWDDFIETAKKLNNPDKGIYGALFLQYDNMSYLLAKQRNVPAYKEDGTSNFDDPAFKESLKFYYDVTNTYKLAPSWLEFKTKKLAPEAFFTGKYAMEFVSSFMLDFIGNEEQYPRDFQVGIVQTPSAGPNGNNNLASCDFYGINNNSAHKEETFKLATFLCENLYDALGRLPARADLTDEEMNTVLQRISDNIKGQMTFEELDKALFNNNMGIVSEKITGEVATEFKANLLREAELYYVGDKSLDNAVKDIKQSTDEAIHAKKEQK